MHIRDYKQQHIQIWNPKNVPFFHIKVYRFAYFLRLFLLKVFWLSAIILIEKNTKKFFDHIIKKFIKFAIEARVNIFLHLKSLISKKLIKNRYFNEIKFWNLSICDVIMRSLKAFQNLLDTKFNSTILHLSNAGSINRVSCLLFELQPLKQGTLST